MPRAGMGSGGGSRSMSSHSSMSRSVSSHSIGGSRPKPMTSSSFSSGLGVSGPSRIGSSSTPRPRPSSSTPKSSTSSKTYSSPQKAPAAHTSFSQKPSPPKPSMPPPPPPPPPKRNPSTTRITPPKPQNTLTPAYHTSNTAGPVFPPKKKRKKRSILRAITSSLAFVILAVVIAALFFQGAEKAPSSTYNREKLDTGVAFQNDCIVDEIGWFDNIPQTEKRLQQFYEATGVQPYIVLLGYNPDIISEADQEAFAEKYYEEHIDNESTFLYVYFASEDEDNDVGGMTTVNGKQISSVMDAEAIEIFWAYLDKAWYSDLSTDDMFVQVFTNTANRIMQRTTTGKDVAKTALIVVGVIVCFAGVVVIILIRRKHERERNEETERILNSPLREVKTDDATLNKYL